MVVRATRGSVMAALEGTIEAAAVSWWYWSAAVLLGAMLLTLDIWVLVVVTL